MIAYLVATHRLLDALYWYKILWKLREKNSDAVDLATLANGMDHDDRESNNRAARKTCYMVKIDPKKRIKCDGIEGM